MTNLLEQAISCDAAATAPLYLDLAMPAGSALSVPVPAGHNAFVYVFEGGVEIAGTEVPTSALAVLGAGDAVAVRGNHHHVIVDMSCAGADPAR